MISGSASGVSTLADGSYSIQVAPGTTLTFQYIGYKAVEYTVPDGRTQVTCNLEMQSDTQALEDVVVIAYGVRKKGTIAGSVSTVKAEKIETTPTAAFDQALQGQVPGLTVLSSSGEPSKSAELTIRGTNSINAGTDPLFVLDGIVISASDFNAINPADIESLSVLKDASSTSIYGARAANGVVVITTKRGRMADRPVINYRMQLGISQLAHGNWDLMNTAERIQYEKEIGLTEGKNYSLLSQTDVNWLDEVFSDNALLQNYELSVSGATEKTNYYVSGGYYDQEGIAPGSDFSRYSLRANIEQRAAKWLKVGTNTLLNYQQIELAQSGEYTVVTPISAARFMMPYWNPRRPDGSIASMEDGSWKGEGQNPLEWIENNPVHYKKYKVISSLFAEATPIEGLTIKSQFSADYSHSTGFGISYPEYYPNLGIGTAARNTSDGLTLSVTNTVNYRFRVHEDHSFNFLVGQEGIDYHYESFGVTTQGQNNDKLTSITTGTRATTWEDEPDDDYGFLSFFGRGMMVKPFEDAVFSAKKGDIVGPVESDFGWHVIYVTDIHPARVRDFNEVRADIEAEYIDQMALREFSEKAEEFTNIVYEQADSLEPAAQKFGLKLMTAEDVTRQGPADPELAPFFNEHVLENLYGSECLQEKRNSAAVEVGSNQLVAARVEKHFPKAVRPFDEVKGQIEDGLKLRKAGELAKAAGEKKVAEVRQSKSLDGFSKAVWVSRQNLLGHPAQLVDRMVALPADKLPAYTGMQVDGGAYFVAFVNAAKVKAPTENELKSLSREFATIYGEADRRGYLSALRQELGEEILRPDFIKGENKGEDAE